ncbi:cytochrome P450 [Dichomitus squalens]|uniref:Cytochrome P450 n=1 Tax=Dichomitus squalens TaxID=114155 RepID=A0A4Q9MH95_9APHY|nr:cytochrome P450 [Dichomitus squalens]
MAATAFLLVVSVIALSVITLVFPDLFGNLTGPPLPPGPRPKLLAGNVHQVPRVEPWKTYADWAKKYGQIFLLRVFGQKIIVLNSHSAVADLLESRSSIYSDRPRVWMYKELIGRKLAVFSISSENPRFRIYRKLLKSGLSSRANQEYLPLLYRETKTLLRNLKEYPDQFISHARRNAAAIILEIAYGWQVNSNDDYFVSLMEESFKLHAEIVRPGRWLVDAYPILRFVPSWFPGGGFHKQAEIYRGQFARIDQIPHAWAKEQLHSGTYTPSFTSRYMLKEDGSAPSDEEEDIIKWTSSALYVGGADTTVSVLTSFFLLMALHPESQKRAQDEIQRVVGMSRLPTADDSDRLPYVRALILEILRWCPVAPLGESRLPHSVTRDDVYDGYRIPKGATVYANIWALSRDPEVYPNPSTFDPERFLPAPNGTLTQMDPRKFVFGFGARVCPGAQFAELSLFVSIARILATFDVAKPVDEHGREVEPKVEFTTTVTSHPKPFECRITPRAQASEQGVFDE